MLSDFVRWIDGVRRYLSARGRWYWLPVMVVAACSFPAGGALVVVGVAMATQGQGVAMSVFLWVSGVLIMCGPVVFLAMALDAVREWLEPGSGGMPVIGRRDGE